MGKRGRVGDTELEIRNELHTYATPSNVFCNDVSTRENCPLKCSQYKKLLNGSIVYAAQKRERQLLFTNLPQGGEGILVVVFCRIILKNAPFIFSMNDKLSLNMFSELPFHSPPFSSLPFTSDFLHSVTRNRWIQDI